MKPGKRLSNTYGRRGAAVARSSPSSGSESPSDEESSSLSSSARSTPPRQPARRLDAVVKPCSTAPRGIKPSRLPQLAPKKHSSPVTGELLPLLADFGMSPPALDSPLPLELSNVLAQTQSTPIFERSTSFTEPAVSPIAVDNQQSPVQVETVALIQPEDMSDVMSADASCAWPPKQVQNVGDLTAGDAMSPASKRSPKRKALDALSPLRAALPSSPPRSALAIPSSDSAPSLELDRSPARPVKAPASLHERYALSSPQPRRRQAWQWTPPAAVNKLAKRSVKPGFVRPTRILEAAPSFSSDMSEDPLAI